MTADGSFEINSSDGLWSERSGEGLASHHSRGPRIQLNQNQDPQDKIPELLSAGFVLH